jgi:hypothetical protein
MNQWDRIQDLESQLSIARSAFLESKGWKHTSDIPDSVWMWKKEHRGRTYLTSESRALAMEVNGIWEPE